MIGKKFGRITVDRLMPKEDAETKEQTVGNWYYCTCDCGITNLKKKGAYLRAGRCQSCGCLNSDMSHEKNMVDMTGFRSGLLTALYEYKGEDGTKNRCCGSILWVCQCDCGNITIVSQNDLRNGGTQSCGCLVSKNELRIKNLLDEYNINYIPQYKIDDLRSPITNHLLRFDFAIFDNDQVLSFVMEYDGEQHEYGSRFSPDPEVNEEKFKRTQLYDELKNEYCASNNIDLLRISWREKDNIEEILLAKLEEKGIIKNGIQKAANQ